MQHTIQYEGVQITVHRARVRDALDGDRLLRTLWENIPEGTWGVWKQFVKLIAQTDQAVGLPFDPSSLRHADKAALDAAYEAFCDLDKALADCWEQAVDLVNKPVDEVGKTSDPKQPSST